MDTRPIGVFDSGLGGLTAVKELTERLPKESIIYFGDTGRVPYGPRGRDIIIKYAIQDVNFLKSFDIKAILIACGTVSTTALDALKEKFDVSFTGVVGSASKKAVSVTRSGRIGVIATAASIASGAYTRAIHRENPDMTVFEKACPLLVPIVENGRFSRGDRIAEILVSEYLESMKAAEIDTLVLGCTHYPLLADIICDYIGSDVTLVNSGAEAAAQIALELKCGGGLSDSDEKTNKFFVSDSVSDFEKYASMYLRREVDGSVKRIDIEKY